MEDLTRQKGQGELSCFETSEESSDNDELFETSNNERKAGYAHWFRSEGKSGVPFSLNDLRLKREAQRRRKSEEAQEQGFTEENRQK